MTPFFSNPLFEEIRPKLQVGRSLFLLRPLGFTLIELMIAFGIFSVVIGGVFVLTNQGQRMYQRGTWQLNQQKSAQQALFQISEDLSSASNEVDLRGGNITEVTKSVALYANCSNLLAPGVVLGANTPAANVITNPANDKVLMAWACFRSRTDSSPTGAWYGCALVYNNKRELVYFRSYDPADFGTVPWSEIAAGDLLPPPAGYDGYPANGFYRGYKTTSGRVLLRDVEEVALFFKEVPNSQTDPERFERSIGIRVRMKPSTGMALDRERILVETTSVKLNRNVRYAIK